MLLNARRLRFFARILLALILLLSGLTAGAFYLLQRNPDALAEHFIEKLRASTGLSISVDAVSVALLPVPALAVSNAANQWPVVWLWRKIRWRKNPSWVLG